jgi:hypothetical protein
MRRLTKFRWFAATLLSSALLIEALPRLFGLTDFPIYLTDPELGYIPAPNQSGRFLNKNAWSFNDRSMPTDVPWNSTLAPNLLLLGNSIVQGGNPIDQRERLASYLQRDLKSSFQVWPIAIGGWSNVNEVMYLERNADVAASCNFFIWEYMAGGLSELSKSRGDLLTPTHPPWFASWYVTRRYILPRYFDFGDSELPPTGLPNPENLAMLEAMAGRLSAHSRFAVHGIIFLYPESDRLELARLGREWLPERPQIEALAQRHNLLVIDIAQQRDWNQTLYRDAVHPSAEGNRVLGQILAEAVERATR